MSKAINYAWRFPSSSGSGTYETLQYEDGTLSCDCLGWTRRVDSNGNRSCKHTRIVQMGRGNEMSSSHGPVGSGTAPLAVTASKPVTVAKPSFKRKFV